MHEISKLRKRLSNVTKSSAEYRMTVVEAKALMAEIDDILYKNKKFETAVEPIKTTVTERIIDGGTF